MKSFLVKGKKPIIRWGQLPDNTFFEGALPDGYKLAITPSEGYIVIDVDRHGDVDGFDNIPDYLRDEFYNTLNYSTKNHGGHFWFKLSEEAYLGNKTSNLGIDLRTHKGYVVWYLEKDVRSHMDEISETSPELNDWLKQKFGFKYY